MAFEPKDLRKMRGVTQYALTSEQKSHYHEMKERIKKLRSDFLEVGKDLAVINQRQYFCGEYDSFIDCVIDLLDLHESEANKLFQSASVTGKLSKELGGTLPNESIPLLILAGLTDEELLYLIFHHVTSGNSGMVFVPNSSRFRKNRNNKILRKGTKKRKPSKIGNKIHVVKYHMDNAIKLLNAAAHNAIESSDANEIRDFVAQLTNAWHIIDAKDDSQSKE